MAIPRSTHDYDIDPAYFALRAPKGGGSSDLEQRVEHLEECCAEVQPALEEMNNKIEEVKNQVESVLCYTLYDSIMPGEGNSYNCKCDCIKSNNIITIYFDIEGTYNETIFPISELIPENCKPYADLTNLIAQSENSFNNILISKTDGQILITSLNKIFNVHCAITYVIVPEI